MIRNKENDIEVSGRIFSKKKILIIVSIVILLISTIGIYASKSKNSQESDIRQGTLQMQEVDLNSKIPGNVEAILVEEGQEVKKGDVIAKISSSTIEAKLKQAESAKKAAEAQANKARAGARNQEIAQAKAAYDYAQKTYDRMKVLVREGAISQAKFDEISAKYIAAKETYKMAVEGARIEDKAAAEAMVGKAEGAVAEVNSYLEDSQIKAPIDGVVSIINVNEGELVSSGMPLASILSKKEPWVEVKVYENELGGIEIGKIVDLKMPVYKNKIFKGKILSVNEKPDFATKRATNENGNFDILSYGVKIKLEECNVDLYKGMTVIVEF